LKIDLINGDCLAVLKTIPDNSIDLIITDLPYGTTACKWDTIIPFTEMWVEIKRIRKDKTAICLFGSEPFSTFLRISNIKEYKYDWIWDKKRISNPLLAKKMPLKNYEIISVFYKKPPIYNPQPTIKSVKNKLSQKGIGKSHSTDTTGKTKLINTDNSQNEFGYPKMILNDIKVMNNLSKDKSGFHPTQKPIELNEYLIKTYSNEGDTVLDFTMGAGSCGIACVNQNRNFIGIELNENYFKIAQDRINEILKNNEKKDKDE
jgi:DNA modification methylase